MGELHDRSRRKAYVLRQLSPRVLLGNMARAREREPGYKYFKIGVACRMSGRGEDLRDFDREASAIERDLTTDREVAARLDALRALGFDVYFGIYDEPWRRDFEINIIRNPQAERLLATEADTTPESRHSFPPAAPA